MRVLVTRPQPQAEQWVQRLRAAGVDAHALPLLSIEGAAAAPLAQAWAALPDCVVFVSPNAVSHFFAARPAGLGWPDKACAAAPGPGTAQALRDEGVPAAQVLQPAQDAAQFDSESLWEQLRRRPWSGREVLVVRGAGGRDWLAQRLREAGARVAFVQAYGRARPRLDAAQQALLAQALAQPARHLWLFSSSEALGHLPALAPGADWSGGRALASHPRIAQAAQELGFRDVQAVPPAFEAVLAAVAGPEGR